ncbi:MAG: hypothetical protein ACI87W_001637 [Halieaceae bacterium]|jgi:hypothetical protein
MSRFTPCIGNWYQDSQTGTLFEVVAIDGDGATLQVQYVDGEIADFDMDSWGELVLLRAAAPEDWRPAFELDTEDELDPDAAMHPLQWGSPLSRIEPETMLGVDEY